MPKFVEATDKKLGHEGNQVDFSWVKKLKKSKSKMKRFPEEAQIFFKVPNFELEKDVSSFCFRCSYFKKQRTKKTLRLLDTWKGSDTIDAKKDAWFIFAKLHHESRLMKILTSQRFKIKITEINESRLVEQNTLQLSTI